MVKLSARSIAKELSNIPDWKTNRHIVVFESDDWGSLRMPSVGSFKRLEKSGINLRYGDIQRFNLNDTLARRQDLGALFEVLSSVKDSMGKNAVFTSVCVVANPDFEKIEASGFQEYYYEPFTETLKRSPGCENAMELWKEGLEKELFVPQMHGREHLNVIAWMKALQAAEKQTLSAFREGVWGFKPSLNHLSSYQAAFDLADPEDLVYHKGVICDGLNLFEELFGYKAVFFVPPNGVFNNSLNQVLAGMGIRYRSGSKVQIEAVRLGKTRIRLHYHGQKDRYGIRYILRNCVFEPSRDGQNPVDRCLNDIDAAFSWQKPAIISTHRVNFVGGLHPENRDHGLRQLSSLLNEIVKRWPDVEFMSTEKLGGLMDDDDRMFNERLHDQVFTERDAMIGV